MSRDEKQNTRRMQHKLEKLDPETRQPLENFFSENIGLRSASRANYAFAVASFCEIVKKPLKDAEISDAKLWIKKIKNKGREDSSINLYGILLKRFFNWLEKPIFEWWQPTKIKSKKKDRLIPEETLKKLFEGATDLKLKTLLGVMWEGALRSAEVRYIQVKNVKFKRDHAEITIGGKTGERTIPIIKTMPWLQMWMLQHPFRDNPEAYIFFTYTWNPQPYTQSGLYEALVALCIKLGIPRRCLHDLRHTRLTDLAPKVKEQALKKFAGWAPDSRMASVYVHLSGRDAVDAVLEAYGMKTPETLEQENFLKPIECPRCKTINPAGAKACYMCALLLDEKAALQAVEEKDKEQQETKERLDRLEAMLKSIIEKKEK